MSCCGSKRSAWRTSTTYAPAPVQTPPVLFSPTRVRYRGEGPIVIRGAVTGFAYVFTDPTQGLDADGRDVADMLQSGHFERDQQRSGH
jgi:hypothetical protein